MCFIYLARASTSRATGIRQVVMLERVSKLDTGAPEAAKGHGSVLAFKRP